MKKMFENLIRRIGNRRYKDELFRFIFRDKGALLQLYNAMNESAYEDPEELEINTLENVLFIGMKNDLSFAIGSTLNLYEHQSTRSSNLPLRGLVYYAELFQLMAAQKKWNLYGGKQIKIPTPQYVVFYNGREELAEREIFRLSDSFENKEIQGCLECTATVININAGHNPELMERCRPLKDYSLFVSEVNAFLDKGLPLAKALNGAIDSCIEKDILKDILLKHRSEVVHMLMTKKNTKWYLKLMQEEWKEQGREQGREQGIEQGREQGIEQGIEALIKSLAKFEVPKEEVAQEIMERYNLSLEHTKEYIEKYYQQSKK
jgi:hypothetical protein